MDAPRGSVEFEEAELERLRRRAYGPNADIDGDVAAQARLAELEAGQRRQLTPARGATEWVSNRVPERVPVSDLGGPNSASPSVPQHVDGGVAERERASGSVVDRDPAEGSFADSGPIDAAPAVPWRRRRSLANLAGVIAAVALIATHVAWSSQLLAHESGPTPTDAAASNLLSVPGAQGRAHSVPTPDHVLALRSVGDDADAPNDLHGTLNALGISVDELRRYDDFQSLNVWSGESRYGVTCVFVAVPGQGLREGYGAEGCSPEGLDTVADLPPMGAGGFTRFLLDGDHINVYGYVRASDPTAPRD